MKRFPCTQLLPVTIIFFTLVLFLIVGSCTCSYNHRHSSGNLFRLQHRYRRSTRQRGSRPFSGNTSVADMRLRDRARHARLLAATTFPLGGIADPNVAGLYFTEVELGTPPAKYYLQVDTGSDLLWVNCASCKTCPMSTQLGVHLALYDPSSSSTSSSVLCGDTYCSTSSGQCQTGAICGYQLGYGDGSSSEGYFVKDTLQLTVVTGNNSLQTTNATVAFGCGTSQGGGLQQSDQALDGIMGFGQSNLSVISQLADQNQFPRAFAHCLEGEGDGGGILVIGNVQAKGLVYTPIIANQPHYNVNLQSILVNGESIPVDSSVSGGGGTIIDSGTTLAYFSDGVYQQLLTMVFSGVQQAADLFTWEGMNCASYAGSVDDVFPSVTFTFEGTGASMVVKPSEYLVQAEGAPGNGWCVGFQTPVPNSLSLNINILGDLVLKDKLVVYDLENQRVGWVNYNCSSKVTVLSSSGQSEQVFASSIPTSSITNSATGVCMGMIQTICWWFLLLLLNNL